MISALFLPLLVALLGQAPPPPSPEDKPEAAAARLDYMKKSVKMYEVHSGDDRGNAYRLLPEPILRYTNTVGESRDGAIFLWLGANDRPEAAVQVFVMRSGVWLHEFSSLSPGPFQMRSPLEPTWNPTRGGVEFKPVPGAPRPAETAEQRLRQMRALAQEFAAEDNFQDKGWQKLRLLTKPFARYGKPDSGLIDGALFCFVLTTDPEVFLLLEARAGKDGSEWQYAFAPMTSYETKGSWKGQEVWHLPWRRNSHDPNEPFLDTPFELPGE